MDTNSIEKELKRKVDSDIAYIVSEFIISVRELQNKYIRSSDSSKDDYNIIFFEWGAARVEIPKCDLDSLETALIRMIERKVGAEMLKSKVKKLLSQVDLNNI